MYVFENTAMETGTGIADQHLRLEVKHEVGEKDAPEMLPNHCKSVPRKKSSKSTPITSRARLRMPEMWALSVLSVWSWAGTGLEVA